MFKLARLCKTKYSNLNSFQYLKFSSDDKGINLRHLIKNIENNDIKLIDDDKKQEIALRTGVDPALISGKHVYEGCSDNGEYGFRRKDQEPTMHGDWSWNGRVQDF